ncbi:Mono polymerase PARP16 [Eumeta japonica]|uniref:Mono polymerase PARP16 n=1 Tax=Eumeta variegata TaxID=151549 RepID=A0A4C1W5D3_EUMVA|nr:Mono polymerase PARP16 [Eumeta japonica]
MDVETEVISETGTVCNFISHSDSLSNQAKLESLEKKAIHLRLVLEKDFKAADLKWSLFVAAAFSFRYETCLKPFPPVFIRNDVKDMDALLTVIADVPALDLVIQQLDNHENLIAIGHVIELLFYVLVRLKEPNIKTIPPDAIVVNLSPASHSIRIPDFDSNHVPVLVFDSITILNFSAASAFDCYPGTSLNIAFFPDINYDSSISHSFRLNKT